MTSQLRHVISRLRGIRSASLRVLKQKGLRLLFFVLLGMLVAFILEQRTRPYPAGVSARAVSAAPEESEVECPNCRSVTLNLDPMDVANEAIHPGTYVDVVGIQKGQGKFPIVDLIMNHVQVLALEVGQTPARGEVSEIDFGLGQVQKPEFVRVNLSVPSLDALTLIYAQETMRLRLLARKPYASDHLDLFRIHRITAANFRRVQLRRLARSSPLKDKEKRFAEGADMK